MWAWICVKYRVWIRNSVHQALNDKKKTILFLKEYLQTLFLSTQKNKASCLSNALEEEGKVAFEKFKTMCGLCPMQM